MARKKKRVLSPERTGARDWDESVILFVQGYGTPEQQKQTIQKMVSALQIQGFNVKDWTLGE